MRSQDPLVPVPRSVAARGDPAVFRPAVHSTMRQPVQNAPLPSSPCSVRANHAFWILLEGSLSLLSPLPARRPPPPPVPSSSRIPDRIGLPSFRDLSCRGEWPPNLPAHNAPAR